MKNKVLKIGIFIFLFCVMNQILDFTLRNGINFSDVMWEEYYEMEDLDVVYVGASVGQCAFNPMIIDEVRKTNSYNMATPAQSLDSTYLALKTVLEEHDIRQVIMGFGYFSLIDSESIASDVTFRTALIERQPFFKRIKNTIPFMFDKENIGESVSVNFLFPWVYNHVDFTIDAVFDNIKVKQQAIKSGKPVRPDDEKITYIGRGFANYWPTMDYNNIGKKNTKSYYEPEIYGTAVAKLREICALCKESGAELIVVNTPRPTFDLVSYGEEYYNLYLWAKTFFEENGAKYYDFNLAKPEVYASKPEYYFDFEHLNYNGSEAFSKAFAVFMERLEQDENMDAYFYNWQEYIESVSHERGR